MKKIKKSEFVQSHDQIVVTPGEMLATLRKLQGLSQVQLAKLTGMNQANISSLESGRQNMGRERAILLAQALHVHPAVIMFPNYKTTPSSQKSKTAHAAHT